MTGGPPWQIEVFSVSQLTSRIRSAITGQFRDIVVQGEVSSPKLYPSGHLYFTLKDSTAVIRAVMFAFAERSPVAPPAEGALVICRGRVDVYEKRGEYQLIVESIEAQGLGALQLQFHLLKEKLAREGLFDAARKRPLPFLPHSVGIITSPVGAAVRDMVKVVVRKFDAVRLALYPVKVQGDEAPAEIVEAIGHFNGTGDVEVIILARGGGAPEDLAPFNDESVARAIYASRIPVVTGIGHETDFTIADFVADARAATPTAAADMVVRDREELSAAVSALRFSLTARMRAFLERAKILLYENVMALEGKKDLFASFRMYVDDLSGRLIHSVSLFLLGRRKAADGLAQRLDDLNPKAILERGYSITARASNGQILREAAAVERGERLRITLHRGVLEADVRGGGVEETGKG